MLDKLLEKTDSLKSLFGEQETLEEVLLKDPFNQKQLKKRLSNLELDLNNPYLINLAAKNDRYEALEYLISIGIKIDTLNAKNENVLFLALKNSALNCAKVLLVKHIDVEQADVNGVQPIHLAAKNGMIEIFDILASRVSDIEVLDKKGRNVLFYAVQSKNEKMIKRVLELTSIDLNFRDKQQNTIIHLSEITHNIDFFKDLVNKGLDINSVNMNNEDFFYLHCLNLDIEDSLFVTLMKKCDDKNRNYGLKGDTLLMKIVNKLLTIDIQVLENKAIATKYDERLITFIEHGVDVNNLNADEENLLFNIIREKNDLVFDFITSRTTIDINQSNVFGHNLLEIAMFDGKPNVELVKKIIYTGFNCNIKDNEGYSIIEKLVDIILSDAIVNRKRKIGKTKSYKSVNYIQLLSFILDYSKVDINTLTFEEEPLIFEIAKSFYPPLLEMMKKYGANLNIISKNDGLNVFYRVLEAGKDAKDERQMFLKTLNFLVLSNVDLDLKDSYGGNVIHKAILDHDLQVINVLTKKVSDFKPRDRKGRTYIHNCIWKNKVDVLKKIALKDKSIMNLPDKFGLLPINYAVIMGKKEVVFTLIKLGAYLNNPYNVNEQFKIHFFCKLGNLEDILNSTMTENERTLMTKLVRSMQDELKIT